MLSQGSLDGKYQWNWIFLRKSFIKFSKSWRRNADLFCILSQIHCYFSADSLMQIMIYVLWYLVLRINGLYIQLYHWLKSILKLQVLSLHFAQKIILIWYKRNWIYAISLKHRLLRSNEYYSNIFESAVTILMPFEPTQIVFLQSHRICFSSIIEIIVRYLYLNNMNKEHESRV